VVHPERFGDLPVCQLTGAMGEVSHQHACQILATTHTFENLPPITIQRRGYHSNDLVQRDRLVDSFALGDFRIITPVSFKYPLFETLLAQNRRNRCPVVDLTPNPAQAMEALRSSAPVEGSEAEVP